MAGENGIRQWFCELIRYVRRPPQIEKKVEQIDEKNREISRDLRNLQTRTDALKNLVGSMREDGTWKRKRR